MALFRRGTFLLNRGNSKNITSVRKFAIFSSFSSLFPKHEQSQASENVAPFPGCKAPYTNEINFTNSKSYDPLPIYRVMHNDGQVIEDPGLSQETVTKMYKNMILLNTMDKILYESQRQGRISFYATNFGEEGLQVASAEALSIKDLIYSQYREAGVNLHRGMTVNQMINQCYGNHEDEGKGRQMPVHYGNKKLNLVTISSTLTTQMPQAVGSAYAFKVIPNNQRCVVCFFGEGAASEGDAHPALNFAATLEVPIIFFCRNNGYAISTLTSEQYKGDGIGARGPAYGINTLRVDGTDVFAVYNATKKAREFAVQNSKPVLIEAMAYRIGHHSTSDDSSTYRDLSELPTWNTTHNPIVKLRLYMENKNWWNQQLENEWITETKTLVLNTMKAAEKKVKPSWKEMFLDVYYDVPHHIQKQINEMEEHMKKYKEHYPVTEFKQ